MSNDMFVNDNEENVVEKEFDSQKNIVPPEYMQVRLSSCGKLSMPEKLHVRDYTGDDVMKLGMVDEEHMFQALVRVVDGLIYENVDAAYMTPQEILEVMLNVYLNYWSGTIEFPYTPTDEELQGLDENRRKAIEEGSQSLSVDVNLDKIQTKPLESNVKEPFRITLADGSYALFTVPRLYNIIKAQEYTEDKYAKEEERFSEIAAIIEYNESLEGVPEKKAKHISVSARREYDDYQRRVAIDRMKAFQCQLVHSIGKKRLDSFEKKYDNYGKISLHFWNAYNEVVAGQLDYGVRETVEVISPLTKQPIERRFQFRVMDFIPTNKLQSTSGYTVSFDD